MDLFKRGLATHHVQWTSAAVAAADKRLILLQCPQILHRHNMKTYKIMIYPGFEER